MSIFLKYNLKKAGKSLSARPGFKQELWQRLDGAFEPGTRPESVWYRHFSVRFAIVLVIAAMLVGTGATGVYAYSSPQVTDGTVLYPVKQSIERVEEKLQTTPEKKAAFLLKQIDRREAEKKVLLAKRKPLQKVNSAIVQVERKLEVTNAALEVTPKKNPVLLQKVQDRLNERKDRLKKIKDQIKNRHNDREESMPTSTLRQKLLDTYEHEVEASTPEKKLRERLRERAQENIFNRERK